MRLTELQLPRIPAGVVHMIHECLIFSYLYLHHLSVIYLEISGASVPHLKQTQNSTFITILSHRSTTAMPHYLFSSRDAVR